MSDLRSIRMDGRPEVWIVNRENEVVAVVHATRAIPA